MRLFFAILMIAGLDVPGFQSAEKFEVILNFIATKAYLNTPWEEYKKSFSSRFDQSISKY